MTINKAFSHVRTRIHPNCSDSLLDPDAKAMRILANALQVAYEMLSMLEGENVAAQESYEKLENDCKKMFQDLAKSEVIRLRQKEALMIISGRAQCADNLMSNKEIAESVLKFDA